MGIYLNPRNDGFKESIRSKIYVDKTELIARTNELMVRRKNISVSAGQVFWQIHGARDACRLLQPGLRFRRAVRRNENTEQSVL